MTQRKALRLTVLVPFLFAAACSSDPAPGSNGGSGGSASGSGGTTGSGGSASGSGGTTGSGGSASGSGGTTGSGGATGSGGTTGSGGATGTGGTDAGATDTSAPEAGGEVGGGDTAASGVVVNPTTGNGRFTFMAQPLTYVHPDATEKAGVPKGSIQMINITGTVFPGARQVTVYKPPGYVANTPVAFMVLFDNTDYINRFKVPTILDNYLAAKKLPPIVGIFVAESLTNRSVEYDSTNDANTRYVMNDIFPEVEKLGIKLSTDPDASCVGGHSSGGIAAFTMAWLRTDRFHKVLSHSGSFLNLRGGDMYYNAIRNTMPRKPIRTFLSAGTMDNGGWLQANENMHMAFMAAGYQYRFIVVQGGTHDQRSPAAMLPESLLWLWAGFPLAGATR